MKTITFVVSVMIGLSSARADDVSDADYYAALQNKCRKAGEGCCLGSVASMETNHFREAVDHKCPLGFTIEMMRCRGSLEWCVPDSAMVGPTPSARTDRPIK